MLKIWKFAALDSAPLFLKPMLAALLYYCCSCHVPFKCNLELTIYFTKTLSQKCNKTWRKHRYWKTIGSFWCAFRSLRPPISVFKMSYSMPTLIGFILAVEDILDEYLVPERIAVPHEETIAEEECSSTIVLERSAFHLLFKAAVSLCVCLCVSVCTPHFFLTRSSDHDYIWHAYADRSGNGSILKI